jgi:hypothetical protein
MSALLFGADGPALDRPSSPPLDPDRGRTLELLAGSPDGLTAVMLFARARCSHSSFPPVRKAVSSGKPTMTAALRERG